MHTRNIIPYIKALKDQSEKKQRNHNKASILKTHSSSLSGSNGTSRHQGLTEASRTPSEEHVVGEDSAYQSHSHSHGLAGSKSSSVTSFAKFPSEESLAQRRSLASRSSSPMEDKPAAEWYAEYRNQSFQQNAPSSKPEYMRSKSQFDAHIAEIKGILERSL